MADFNFVMLGFPTADAAEQVATRLGRDARAGRFHVTQVGPEANDGSRYIKLIGADPEPAEARPGALIAGILAAGRAIRRPSGFRRAPVHWPVAEGVELDDALTAVPPDLESDDPWTGLTADLRSALIFRTAAGQTADELTAQVLDSVWSAGQAHPTVVTGFALDQPATVTMGSINRELTSVTGSPLEVRFDEDSGTFHVAPEPEPGRSGGSGGPGDPVPARVERFIEGRCQERVKVGQPTWIAVQIAARTPEGGGALSVDLPAGGTRVYATLLTSGGLRLESEPDLELRVPPDRNSGWHAWQVSATRTGTHQAVASFHHDGEVLAALGFTLRAGATAGSDQQSPSELIDLRSLDLRQGLLVVRRGEGMLRFIGLDGARQGEGITAAAQKVLQPQHVKLLAGQKKRLDAIARANRMNRSRAADADDVRAMGLELFDFLPGEIRDFLVSGLGRWQSLKIEADDETLPWELLAQRHQRTDTFFANELPFLRWRLGLPQPGMSIACQNAILVPGQQTDPADADTDSFEQQIQALRTQLGAGADAVVRSRSKLQRRIKDGDFDLLHYCGHMSVDEGGSPAMHVGNDEFNVSGISSLRPNALARRPLVFLNACATNKKVQRLSGPGGWVEDFLAKGAGAFIGTNWTVRASTAARFAEHFYDALLGSGQSDLAAASALARQQTAADEGAGWVSLAYTVYGHPAARIQAGS